MRNFRLPTLIQTIVAILLLSLTGKAELQPNQEAAKLLPERIGVFKAVSAVTPLEVREDNFRGTSAGSRDYQLMKDGRVTVFLFKSASDSGSYARLNNRTDPFNASPTGVTPESRPVSVGTAGYMLPNSVYFYKGPVFVAINGRDLPAYSEALVDFARQFAGTLDKGEGEIPALVKHLPDSQNGVLHSFYALNLPGLKKNVPNQLVLDAVSFEGGVEAVSADYGPARLVIVESNTPQLATENDARIAAKINELRSVGQTVPSAYRRVGNYSVFVFDAPSETAANQLIDQVKYQQIVQWLGENPYSYREAVAEFTQTTLGVLVSVVKASGLVLLGSLFVGGFLGALLFSRRRAEQQVARSYSDAGGMLRLNIDEINPETDPARLIGPGN